MDTVNPDIYGNSLFKWLIAIAIVFGAYFLLRFVKVVVAGRMAKWAEKTSVKVDDLLIELIRDKTKTFFLLILSIYIGSLFLNIPPKVSWAIRGLIVVAFFLQAALWGNAAIAWFFLKTEKKEGMDKEKLSTYNALAFVSKLLLWSLLILLALHNLGVNITALVASLGIGGVAVALALQNILGDIFASMSIVLDKPFEIGDFVIVDDLMGTVEHIGLKTTRVRSLSGEQIVFSNNDLLGSRIRNYKRMWERRVVFSIGVVYQTSYDQLASIPDMLKQIVESKENTRYDRAHFKNFGDSSLNFEIVYYVKVPEYNTYMDIQEEINLEIFRRFEEQGIGFAYPTRTIILEEQEKEEPRKKAVKKTVKSRKSTPAKKKSEGGDESGR